jgi:hypothetical protein
MRLRLADIIVLDAALAMVPVVAESQTISPPPGPINVTSFTPVGGSSTGATADAIWGVTDCAVSSTSTDTVICTRTSLSSAYTNKLLVLDDGAGVSGGQGVPLVAEICGLASSGSTSTITVGPLGCIGSLSVSPQLTHITGLLVSTGGSNQLFGSAGTSTLACTGTCAPAAGGSSAMGTPGLMSAVSGSLINPGTVSGLTGPCDVALTDQTNVAGEATTLALSVSSSHAVTLVTIAAAGLASAISTSTAVNGSNLYLETPSTCTNGGTPYSISGSITIGVSYGVVLEQTTQEGLYTVPPACNGTTSASMTQSGAAGGLTVLCPTVFTSAAAFGTDNTFFFEAALALANADTNAYAPRPIYVPGGNYLIRPLNTQGNAGYPTSGTYAGMCATLGAGNSISLTGSQCNKTGACSSGGTCVANLDTGYGAWIGDEHYQSNIFVVPETSSSGTPSDVFSWYDSNTSQSAGTLTNTQSFAGLHANQAGSSLRNLAIIGDRETVTEENGASFYGPTEALFVDNVAISYMRGHAIGSGYEDSNMLGNLSESRIVNSAFDNNGDGPSVPTLDFDAYGANGPNNIDLANVSVVDS